METGNLEQIIVRRETKNLESIIFNVNKGVQKKERNRWYIYSLITKEVRSSWKVNSFFPDKQVKYVQASVIRRAFEKRL